MTRGPRGRSRRRRSAALALAGLVLGACAPHRVAVPEFPAEGVETRYRAALAAREERTAAVESDVALWVVLPEKGALPGVQGGLLLAAPDAFRLRIGSAFGTALDLAASGDSVTLYVPARRAFTQLDAAADSLGLTGPGALVLRIWSGTWRAPGEAFAAAETSAALIILRWTEEDDSLALALAPSGLPAWVRLARPGGTMRVEYPRWGGWAGVRWPARIEIGDPRSHFHVTCRVQRVQFFPRLDPHRLRVRPPASAERVTWKELRRAHEHIPSF